jgi:hypothetical protein
MKNDQVSERNSGRGKAGPKPAWLLKQASGNPSGVHAMFKNKTVSLALALAALPLAATAAFAGHVQSPQNYYGSGSTVSAAASAGTNLYAPSGIGNITGNTQMNYAPGSGGSTSFSGLTGGVNVQTNIDNSKQIDSSSNINVTETINGEAVAYGLNGATALSDINNNMSYDASVSAQYTGSAENLESDALAVAQEMGQ